MDLREVRRPLAALPTALAAVFATGLALGCGGDRYIVIGTSRAPSASGFVRVNAVTADAAKLTVHMEQLHPVDSLDPALHAYAVWFESGKAKPVLAGSLHYRPDDRVGELEAVSPFRKFIVKITAEANDKPAAESAFVIASQEVSLDD
jgi:hypothetical protein